MGTNEFSISRESAYDFHYLAFFGDCEHEVKRVTCGQRVCLVYNLCCPVAWGATPQTPVPLDMTEEINSLAHQLESWAADESASFSKLMILLEDKYLEEGIHWTLLKPRDQAYYQLLSAAAKVAEAKQREKNQEKERERGKEKEKAKEKGEEVEPGFDFYLTLVDIYEEGLEDRDDTFEKQLTFSGWLDEGWITNSWTISIDTMSPSYHPDGLQEIEILPPAVLQKGWWDLEDEKHQGKAYRQRRW